MFARLFSLSPLASGISSSRQPLFMPCLFVTFRDKLDIIMADTKPVENNITVFVIDFTSL